MANKPIREQSAIELLETHAQALTERYENLLAEYGKVITANAEVAKLNAEQAETIEQLREAIQWVVTDASYKPPEQIDAIVTERWITRLRSALQSESRDG